MEFDGPHRQSFNLLDLHFHKGRRFNTCGKLDIGIHRKDTSQWVPLSKRSCHSPSVHSSWPKGLIGRYRALCSSPTLWRTAVNDFVARYRDKEGALPEHKKRPFIPGKAPVTSRIVLPFKPVWAGAKLNMALRGINYGNGGVAVVWRNGYPNHQALVRKFNCRTDDDPEKFSIFVWERVGGGGFYLFTESIEMMYRFKVFFS